MSDFILTIWTVSLRFITDFGYRIGEWTEGQQGLELNVYKLGVERQSVVPLPLSVIVLYPICFTVAVWVTVHFPTYFKQRSFTERSIKQRNFKEGSWRFGLPPVHFRTKGRYIKDKTLKTKLCTVYILSIFQRMLNSLSPRTLFIRYGWY